MMIMTMMIIIMVNNHIMVLLVMIPRVTVNTTVQLMTITVLLGNKSNTNHNSKTKDNNR